MLWKAHVPLPVVKTLPDYLWNSQEVHVFHPLFSGGTGWGWKHQIGEHDGRLQLYMPISCWCTITAAHHAAHHLWDLLGGRYPAAFSVLHVQKNSSCFASPSIWYFYCGVFSALILGLANIIYAFLKKAILCQVDLGIRKLFSIEARASNVTSCSLEIVFKCIQMIKFACSHFIHSSSLVSYLLSSCCWVFLWTFPPLASLSHGTFWLY